MCMFGLLCLFDFKQENENLLEIPDLGWDHKANCFCLDLVFDEIFPPAAMFLWPIFIHCNTSPHPACMGYDSHGESGIFLAQAQKFLVSVKVSFGGYL